MNFTSIIAQRYDDDDDDDDDDDFVNLYFVYFPVADPGAGGAHGHTCYSTLYQLKNNMLYYVPSCNTVQTP